ncbi:hypothetical protein D3C84_816460 [compost metagenome]
MHKTTEGFFALQRRQQLAFKVEAGDQCWRIHTQVIEAIAQPHPLVERCSTVFRKELAQACDSATCMATGGIIDGDVELEVMAIDAQFRQFMGSDQQVQRWLFVAEVVADHLSQECFAVLPQCQLQRALLIAGAVQRHAFKAAQTTEQALVDQDMIAAWVAVTQFLEKGADQAVVAWVAPVPQSALQPGTIDDLGRRHLLHKP